SGSVTDLRLDGELVDQPSGDRQTQAEAAGAAESVPHRLVPAGDARTGVAEDHPNPLPVAVADALDRHRSASMRGVPDDVAGQFAAGGDELGRRGQAHPDVLRLDSERGPYPQQVGLVR